ncbi:MAG: ATP-binding cassette domain-containing protein [Gemmatimonadota bacterium]|nr:ATP-binding cassette domain-containing protein [Gemmatimonadota bacterium]
MKEDRTVEVRGLVKTFWDRGRGRIQAVDGIDFVCEPGQVFGLLGANGAGKTTTLRVLATILEPTEGSATVDGHDVRHDPEGVRRSIGFHSASTALYPRLTARETLRFFARVNGYPEARIEGRVDALLDRFGIRRYADARVDTLSSGMKQKVAIARTVAHDPPVLVFDEPSVGLDVVNALELRRIVRELRDLGKAIIFSTHVMPEAERVCDRIAIMHRGRILSEGTLEEHRARTGLHYLEDIFVAGLEGDEEDDLGDLS